MDRAANIKNDTPPEEGAGFIDWFAGIGPERLIRSHSQWGLRRKCTQAVSAMRHVFQENLQAVSLPPQLWRPLANDVAGIPVQDSSSPVAIVANSVRCATTW